MRARLVLLTLAAAILMVALAASGCSSTETASPDGAATTTAAYQTVDVQTANDALSSNADAQLLDVREPSEWAETGVVRGAVLVPLGEVESRASAGLAKDQPVYVMCRTGHRSRIASETLVGLGYTQVYNVDGGITAWLDAGLPVEAYTP